MLESLRFDFEYSMCYLGLFNCTSNNFSKIHYILENFFKDFNINKCKVSSTMPDTQAYNGYLLPLLLSSTSNFLFLIFKYWWHTMS